MHELRERILSALMTGRLQEGDRLPSIRDSAEALGCSRHAIVNAYTELSAAGIVESRERSGMYVPSLSRFGAPPPGETARWLAQVLASACDHQIRIPFLPELLRRWTTSDRLVCACIESDGDSLATLRGEVEHRFGVETISVDASRDLLPQIEALDEVPEPLRRADLWVATTIHAPLLHDWAEEMNKPLVVASMHPDHVVAIERHLQERPLTAVCLDPRHGDRLRTLFAATQPDRIRTVGIDDHGALARLGPEEPVLLTRAARDRIPQANLRLIVPISPAFCPGFSHQLASVLLRMNMEADRPA